MFAFIVRRIAQAVLVMVTVAFIAFMLFQYVGDPVVFLLGQDATPAQIIKLRSDLGLDRPFFIQFWHFLINAAQGEFGLSLRQGALDGGSGVGSCVGRSDGRLRSVATGQLFLATAHDHFPAGRVPADIPHWHPSDSGVLGESGLVSELWKR